MRNRVSAAIAALAVFAAILIPSTNAEARSRAHCGVRFVGGGQPVACRAIVRPSHLEPAWLRNLQRDWWW